LPQTRKEVMMTKQRYTGFDYFTPDAGKIESMTCGACNEVMAVARNVDYLLGTPWGPRHKSPTRKIDEFTCDNSNQDWHDQVIALRRFQRGTPSSVLSKLVEEEIIGIIESRTPTKKNWGF
jgi:hypothetical protein